MNYNSYRIAFVTRSLNNIYNTYNDKIKRMITEINIRHDNSKRYPQSALNYRLKRKVIDEYRKSLKNLFDFASYWKLNDKRDMNS